MITNILFALGGSIAGFLVCALFCGDRFVSLYCELLDAHKRCADSQSIALEKLRAIREIANKPQTIRKGDIRAVLGDAA